MGASSGMWFIESSSRTGVHGDTAADAAQFIAQSFSFIFIPAQRTVLGEREDQELRAEGSGSTGKKWHSIMEPLSKQEADALLKYVLNKTCDFYNTFVRF